MAEGSTLPYINAEKVFEFLRIDNYSFATPDAVFILGSGGAGPVYRAISSLGLTSTRRVFFSSAGGNFGGNIVFGYPEVEEYARILRMRRVDDQHIHFPPRPEWTTNTLMEARAAIPFIEGIIGYKPTRLMLCARGVHMRRVLATFQKQNPEVEFVCNPDEERCTVELLPRLVQEVDRLREYGAKGDLEVQDIPDDVARIVEEIRAHLKMPADDTILWRRHTLGMKGVPTLSDV